MNSSSTPTLLVVWEDRYCDELHRLLKRSVRYIRSVNLPMNKESVEGNGKFKNYLKTTWPIVRKTGFLRSSPIDYLICVADADRASKCCTSIREPTPSADLTEWIKASNEKWTEELRDFTSLDPDRIHGRFFRWNKESVPAACYDSNEVLAKLGIPNPRILDNFLDKCKPVNPRTAEDADFTHQFRKPGNCLKEGFENVGIKWPGKNAQIIDDAIGKASEVHLEKLLKRLPDLRMLAELIISFDSSAQEEK